MHAAALVAKAVEAADDARQAARLADQGLHERQHLQHAKALQMNIHATITPVHATTGRGEAISLLPYAGWSSMSHIHHTASVHEVC